MAAAKLMEKVQSTNAAPLELMSGVCCRAVLLSGRMFEQSPAIQRLYGRELENTKQQPSNFENNSSTYKPNIYLGRLLS